MPQKVTRYPAMVARVSSALFLACHNSMPEVAQGRISPPQSLRLLVELAAAEARKTMVKTAKVAAVARGHRRQTTPGVAARAS